MGLLEIHGLTHDFGENLLYRDAELTLHKGEHVGIVGPNGAGKSTLLKICTDRLIPDAGTVIWQADTSIGYLDQYAEIDRSLTLREFLRSAFAPLYRCEREMLAFYERAAGGEPGCLERAARIQEALERADFYSIGARIEQAAAGLGLSAVGLERPIGQMSGGQRAKAILAKLLLEKPDVLLLDEPTNFLDREQVDWLAACLSGLENAYMVVSHDFAFLDRIANRICDVDGGQIAKYYGSYSEFLQKKTFQREEHMRRYSAQQREIERTEEFIRRNLAGRKSKMARGRQKQLDRLDRLEAPGTAAAKPLFPFTALPLTGTEHLSVDRLAVGYYYPVLSDVDFAVKGGQKVAITGFNGIGKSTLLKTLLGQLPVLKGRFRFSEQVTCGYFEQDFIWSDSGRSPVQLLSDAYPELAMKAIRKRLAQCGISSQHAMQPIGSLSGGEQAKVKLCLLTLHPCNFLILDEPTNHLDAPAKEALKDALIRFPGTVLLVSHEERFYSDWVQRVIRV